ncbi:ABC transporter ATP-binding protein [Kitasatospora sp. LaBMicrA B282]|uniref:ABC transporter ATP-binding protein n=1 Tax=Kitasatospora sp. LaBMicrA B282 TaxID=3420949 RepID=UPI003D09E69F
MPIADHPPARGGQPMVEVDHLTRTYTPRRGTPVTALDDVSFTLRQGEVLGLLGPNGAGKTTLSRILTTLLLPSSGTARIAGFDVVARPREVRRHIGLVLGGDRGLYGRLTARQNLRYWAALQGLDGSAARARTEELLERLGLAARAGDRVETFSRGMTQRVHLARALLNRPAVLILDEPTNGMDPHSATGFRELVRELRAAGTTILLTTHDLPEAQDLCSHLAMVDHGRLLRWGTRADLLAEVGFARTVTATGVPAAARARIELLPGTVTAEEGGVLSYRPHDEDALAEALTVLAQARAAEISVTAPSLAEVYRSVIEDREFVL